MTRSPSHLVPLIAFFLAVPAAAQVAFEDQVLVPLQGGPYDGYGERIEIDGDRLLVGSRGLVGASFQPASQVVVPLAYVYDRAPDGTWQLAAELDPTAPAFPSSGLHDVALDGDWAFVTSRTGHIRVPVRLMDGVNRATVWTWNAIGKKPGAWGLSLSLAQSAGDLNKEYMAAFGGVSLVHACAGAWALAYLARTASSALPVAQVAPLLERIYIYIDR